MESLPKRFKNYFLVFSVFLFSFIFHLSPNPVFAEGEVDPAGFSILGSVFTRFIGISAVIGGFLAFIMLIIGGIRYITASGDPKNLEGARGTITWAIGGLIFLGVAALIMRLIETITGAHVLNFNINIPPP